MGMKKDIYFKMGGRLLEVIPSQTDDAEEMGRTREPCSYTRTRMGTRAHVEGLTSLRT